MTFSLAQALPPQIRSPIFSPVTCLIISLATCLILAGCTNLSALRQQVDNLSYTDAAIRYGLLSDETQVGFAVGQTRGQFRVADAQLSFTQPHYSSAVLEVTLATASVDVFNPVIERMLRGKEWFASKQHPFAQFRTTSLASLADDQAGTEDTSATLAVEGILEIKGIAEPLTLQVTFPDGLPDLNQPPGQFDFIADGSFSRAEYDMRSLPGFAPDVVSISVQGAFSLLPTEQQKGAE